MKDLQLARTIWKHFHPMLVSQLKPVGGKRGRPRASERRAFLGVCYLLWSGCSWRALPSQYGARSTVHRYFIKWARTGLFRELWRIAIMILKDHKLISDRIQIVDGSQVLVQHLPRSVAFVSPKHKPKRAIKFSLLVDAKGTPLSVVLGTANQHDSSLLFDTLSSSLLKPQDSLGRELLGDKGYIGPRQEITANVNGLVGIFPPRKNQLNRLKASSLNKLKQHRWKVERTISWLKSLRRLKYCYERSFESFQALLELGCLMISVRKIMS